MGSSQLDVEKIDIKLGRKKKITKGIYRARNFMLMTVLRGELAIKQSKALVGTFKKNFGLKTLEKLILQ